MHSTTWEGHIFSFVRNWIDEKKKISKPIYSCPICMTPYYGTALYLIFFNHGFADWFLTIGAAAGLSVIYVLIIEIKDNGKQATDK